MSLLFFLSALYTKILAASSSARSNAIATFPIQKLFHNPSPHRYFLFLYVYFFAGKELNDRLAAQLQFVVTIELWNLSGMNQSESLISVSMVLTSQMWRLFLMA
jgi:hypothetical protein